MPCSFSRSNKIDDDIHLAKESVFLAFCSFSTHVCIFLVSPFLFSSDYRSSVSQVAGSGGGNNPSEDSEDHDDTPPFKVNRGSKVKGHKGGKGQGQLPAHQGHFGSSVSGRRRRQQSHHQSQGEEHILG